MTENRILTSVKGNKIRAQWYGNIRFQSNETEIIEAPEYSFDSIQLIIDEIKKAQDNNFDRVILLTGGERDGKSTLAAHLATRLGNIKPRNVAFTAVGFLKGLNEAEDFGVTWMDEGARGMYSRDAMTKFNKQLTKAFTQIGIKKLVSVICLPHRELLDLHLRERRVHYWGSVVTKGYQRGYVKWRIAGKPNRRADEQRIPKHGNEWSINTYWEPLFVMRFPVFRENNGFKWEEYETWKRENLGGFFEESTRDESPKKAITSLTKAIHWMKKEGFDVGDIAEKTGLSEPSVYRYLKKPPIVLSSS